MKDITWPSYMRVSLKILHAKGVYGASLVKIGEIGSGHLFKSLARVSEIFA